MARRSLESYLDSGEFAEVATDRTVLLEPCATFVTLTKRATGELRGCRGEYRATQPLIDSVAHMAIASATDDPRFPPVTLQELPAIRIDINALTDCQPIQPHQVVVGRHGLLIRSGYNAGLLLPGVPVEQGWDREQFLVCLCRKAGLPDDGWTSPDAELLGFESEAWGEET